MLGVDPLRSRARARRASSPTTAAAAAPASTPVRPRPFPSPTCSTRRAVSRTRRSSCAARFPRRCARPRATTSSAATSARTVCPWNRSRPRTAAAGSPRPARATRAPRGVAGARRSSGSWRSTRPGFQDATRGTALRRTRYRGLLRNALVAAGNAGTRGAIAVDPALRAAVARHAEGGDEILREHARWALARIDRVAVASPAEARRRSPNAVASPAAAPSRRGSARRSVPRRSASTTSPGKSRGSSPGWSRKSSRVGPQPRLRWAIGEGLVEQQAARGEPGLDRRRERAVEVSEDEDRARRGRAGGPASHRSRGRRRRSRRGRASARLARASSAQLLLVAIDGEDVEAEGRGGEAVAPASAGEIEDGACRAGRDAGARSSRRKNAETGSSPGSGSLGHRPSQRAMRPGKSVTIPSTPRSSSDPISARSLIVQTWTSTAWAWACSSELARHERASPELRRDLERHHARAASARRAARSRSPRGSRRELAPSAGRTREAATARRRPCMIGSSPAVSSVRSARPCRSTRRRVSREDRLAVRI